MRDETPSGSSVSCQSVQVYLRYVQSLGLDDRSLLQGLPFPPEHLRDGDARIDYDTFREISRRFSAMFPDDPDAAYQAGLSVPKLQSLGYIVMLLAMRVDPAIVFSQTSRMVQRQFPMVRVSYRRTGSTRCRLSYEYVEGFEPFPEFEKVALGLMEATPCMAGLAPAQVELLPNRLGFDIDVRWSGKGKLLPRLRAATMGRLESIRDAMTELETAKDRVEAQLAETQKASQRLQALLAIGHAVETGLDVDDLTARFGAAAQKELGLRLLHVHLFETADESAWEMFVGTVDVAEGAVRVELPAGLASHRWGDESVWAVRVDGQAGPMGVAFVASKRDLMHGADVDRALLGDAFKRLGHALGNALRHRELSTYGEKLEEQVHERTAEIAAQTEQLRATNQKLVDLDRAKRRFFTHLSHELRTPATLLSASLEQLERQVGRRDETADAALRRARRNMARVIFAVDDLLDLALLDEAKMPAAFESVDATEMVRSLLAAVEPWASSCGVEVRSIAPEQPAVLTGDARLLEKAVLNLVANAVKFSSAGDRVVVGIMSADDEVRIAIDDEGPGVSANDRARIFQAFEQGDHKGSQRGIGIGLSLVQAIASLHGGSVCLEDREPRGARFVLTLPAHADPSEHRASEPRPRVGTVAERSEALMARLVERDSQPPSSRADVVDGVWSGSRPRVLVVDDEPEIREVLRLRLASTYDVQLASNALEALAFVDRAVPAAVLADVSMPGMSGFELCRRLRERAEMRQVPILLVTALGSVEDKLQGFDAGADDYVSKPFSLREVEARLRTQLDLRRLSAEMNAMSTTSLMGSVAAGIAHEVNNPLNVLVNALPVVRDSLIGDGDGETGRLMLELAEDATRRIHECVSAISSLASWSGGVPESVDLLEFVSTVARQHRTRNGGATEVAVTGGCSRPMGLRRTEAAMVLGNLVANAVDAAGPGGRVLVDVSEERDHAVVRVTDDGPGMDEVTMRKACEPFFTTKEPGRGMGLGLFLVRQLLRHLDGRMELRSQLGEGTTVTVLLPFARVARE